MNTRIQAEASHLFAHQPVKMREQSILMQLVPMFHIEIPTTTVASVSIHPCNCKYVLFIVLFAFSLLQLPVNFLFPKIAALKAKCAYIPKLSHIVNAQKYIHHVLYLYDIDTRVANAYANLLPILYQNFITAQTSPPPPIQLYVYLFI